MSDAERRGTEDPPRYPVVTKTGLIKLVMVAPGINGALFEYEGEIKVAPSHEKEKWVLLEKLYEDEGRLDHWAVWQDYQRARKAGMECDPLPDEYLPQEVLRRRAGHIPGKKRWSPPGAQPAVSEEKRGPGRPKKEV